MTRGAEEIRVVQALAARGVNDCEISRRTGVPRTTVRDWRSGRVPGQAGVAAWPAVHCDRCSGTQPRFPGAAYAYLLGIYLGDGCLSEHPRAYRLRITLDARYPEIVRECVAAIESVRPGRPVRAANHGNARCVEVSSYWQHWPCLFPQHGRGKKHLRPIQLERWQATIVASQPRPFLRGLIHSDGCRIVANDRGRLTARYSFSNRSDDIKQLFCRSLDAVGVHWTRPCDRKIAVYRKDSVAILDRFIGPKA